MKNIVLLIECLIVCIGFQNCARQMYMTPISAVKHDSLLQVTDEQIREAFLAKPQLTKPLTVAIYNASFDNYPLLDSLEKMNGISSVFMISPWLLEADEYRSRVENQWYSRYMNPVTTPIKAVRLEAAKGKADLLVYVGITHAYKEEPNFLAWTYLGILTMGFVPGQKYHLTTSVDMVFIDTRNGYYYGTYHDETTVKGNYVSLAFHDSYRFNIKKQQQVEELLPGMLMAAKRILSNKNYYIDSAAP